MDEETSAEGDVIEIEQLDDYDSQKAKLRASLLWLLHKAYPDGIPQDLRGLFYETGEGGLHILPHLANLLVSSEIYCLACTSLFKETAYQWQGHMCIIQVLSRKGIYVMETEDVAVTPTVLVQTAPFRINAHLALIDALMTAYTSEILSVQNVVQAVRRITTFNASSELPSSVEDAGLFWLNKVSKTLLQKQEEDRKLQQQQLIQGETTQKVRFTRKNLSPKEFAVIEEMKDIVNDISDGCSMAATISFYCPQSLKFNDICMKKNLGIADSLFNLRLVKNFCEKCVSTRIFHFEYVDLLYSNESLRTNFMAFISELFHLFEIEKTDSLLEGNRPSTASKVSNVANVPISEVTRRSFHRCHNEESSSSPLDLSHVAPSPTSHIAPRQILLPKRAAQEEAGISESPPTHHGRSTHQSILAWQEDSEISTHRPHNRKGVSGIRESPIPNDPVLQSSTTGSQGSHLLANVSIDSEILDSYRSVDLEGLGESLEVTAAENKSPSPVNQRTSPLNGDNVELLNITSSCTSTQMSNQMGLRSSMHSPRGDPLLPARIKAAKEKGLSHSKAEERGENLYRKAQYPSVRRAKQGPVVSGMQGQSDDLSVKVSSGSSSSVPSEDMIVTPLPPEQLESDMAPVAVPSHSYTIPDVASTTQAAILHGIPVVSESLENGVPSSSAVDVMRRSRQSSVTSNLSNRSSGEFSDHESQKIHLDHKSRESAIPKEMSPSRSVEQMDSRPDTLPVVKPIIIEGSSPLILSEENKKLSGPTTSFAQIKKLRDDGQYDNSGLVFMQHGQESNSNTNKMSLKAAFQRKQTEGNRTDKKTTFATLPNQTTWQQNAQRMQQAGTSQHSLENGDQIPPMSSELLHVRMKLEEKRRVIEREKHRQELQKSKQRQRLGKAAFLHVLSKKDGKENAIQEQPEASMTRSAEERIPPMQGATSAMTTSQPNFSEPMVEMASSGSGRPTRTFSREDIQNTIENVRKKWFSDQNGGDYSTRADPSRSSSSSPQLGKAQEPTGRSSEKATTFPAKEQQPLQRSTPPLDTRKTPPLQQEAMPRVTPPPSSSRESGVQGLSRQSPQPSRESPPQRQPTNVQKTSPIVIASSAKATVVPHDSAKDVENYEQYNSSLDKLNHSLSELQGEIMRLSLKQEQAKNSPTEPIGPVIGAQTVVTSGRKAMVSPLPRAAPPPATLWQGQGYGKHPAQGEPLPQPAAYPSSSQAYVNPTEAQQHQAPFMLHGHTPVNYPTGAVYTSPTHLNGGIIQPQPQFSLQSPPMYQQMYQQSPTYAGQQVGGPYMMQMPPGHMSSQPYLPPSAGHGLPLQPPLSAPGYPQHPQYNGTYTVPSNSHPHPVPCSSSSNPASQPQQQHTFQDRASSHPVPSTQTGTLSEDPIPTGHHVHQYPTGMDNALNAIHGNDPAFARGDGTTVTQDQKPEESAGTNEGFFVCFGEDTPKRPKPKLGKDRVEESAKSGRPSTPSRHDDTHNSSAVSSSPSPVAANNSHTEHNSSGIGFVIGEDESVLDKTIEDEMQKKREKMLQLQQKRREEQEKKRQEKEVQEAERREKERRKQEEAENRKSEEKARRDAIFQKYKERKAKDDQDDNEEVRPRKERPRDRPRPKSMIVKTRTPVNQNGGPVRAGNSTDDIHSSLNKEVTAPSPVPSSRLAPKRGKLYRPASCHLMDTADGDPRTAIAISGSLTHRRPPSPDLYARFQRNKSSARGPDSTSETGSAAGSDYAGPKLYVKPSQKSNRHIIMNAISHVCLAGTVNTDLKNKVLDEISRSEAKHFMILFRSAGCQFRGLYTFDPDTEFTFKLMGAGPKQLTNKSIETFYKYNSGAKKFNIVASTKHISVSIDAVVAHNSVWKPSKQTASKR